MSEQAKNAMQKRWVAQLYQLRKAARLEEEEDFRYALRIGLLVVTTVTFLVVFACL